MESYTCISQRETKLARGMSFKRMETTILNLKIAKYIAGGLSEIKSCNLDSDEQKHNMIPAWKDGIRWLELRMFGIILAVGPSPPSEELLVCFCNPVVPKL